VNGISCEKKSLKENFIFKLSARCFLVCVSVGPKEVSIGIVFLLTQIIWNNEFSLILYYSYTPQVIFEKFNSTELTDANKSFLRQSQLE
jgi:hypothetical protein